MVKKIVLSVAAVLFACTSLFAQNKQVTGAVSGPDGSPIVGATVVVEGTTIGTSTDLQGKYVLSAPANGTLIVSFIGYEDAKELLELCFLFYNDNMKPLGLSNLIELYKKWEAPAATDDSQQEAE